MRNLYFILNNSFEINQPINHFYKLETMKLSIKILAIIALLLTFSFAANAQRGDRQAPEPEEMAERQTAGMVEHLSLDENQAVQVAAINLTYANKMKEAHENNEGDREAMKEIRATIDAEKAAELKLLLTEEQFIAFEKMLAEKGNERKGKGPRGGRN